MRILLAGGGTGGHINPAIAIAGEVLRREPESKILFAGTPHGMEAALVPKAGYDFVPIKVAGFQRRITPHNIIRNFKALFYLSLSGRRAKKIIRDFEPDIVVGTGGYVSGPVLRAAAQMGIKTAIHEQNAFPGVTTRLLAKNADKIMLAFQKAAEYLPREKCVVTGNPIRESIIFASREASRQKLGLDSRPVLLSFGGSLGAETINKIACEFIAANEDGAFQHIHATGQYGTELVPRLLRERGIEPEQLPAGTSISCYIDNMDECLAACDLVLCRAGAITLSELMAAGRGAVLVPSPNVSENHQFHNATEMAKTGAALCFEEKNLKISNIVFEIVNLLKSPDSLKKMSLSASKNASPDANANIFKIIDSLLRV